jgi:hypothetical protein
MKNVIYLQGSVEGKLEKIVSWFRGFRRENELRTAGYSPKHSTKPALNTSKNETPMVSTNYALKSSFVSNFLANQSARLPR